MVDTQTALEAHRNLTWIADHWPELKAHLHPPRGGAMTGMPVALGDGGVPINIHVSDLLHTITVEAETLARVLWDELDEPTSFTPRTTMPDLLRDVAARYGHWTAQDERTALAFCDWAHEYRWRVWRVITQPDPARYIGPCPAAECEGELYLKPGRNLVQCPECGRDVRMEEQVEWLHAQMESHLLERDELHPALRILGHDVTRDQVRKWIERERLAAVGDGLFRLRDAIDLATRSTREDRRMRIDEFLLERIAEDEAAAHFGRRHNDRGAYANDNYGCLLVDPARVLAECEAKRRVVAEHAAVDFGEFWACGRCGVDVGATWVRPVWPCPTIRALAAVYRDHPDYDPAWAI